MIQKIKNGAKVISNKTKCYTKFFFDVAVVLSMALILMCIYVGARHIGEVVSEFLPKEAHASIQPKKETWVQIANYYSKARKLDSCLVQAVALKESSGCKNMRSPDGQDLGCMGVNVKSARDICHLTPKEIAKLETDHDLGFWCGTLILETKLNEWKGQGVRRYNGFDNSLTNINYEKEVLALKKQCEA